LDEDLVWSKIKKSST